jgi:RimJ/RimL family protein N-acetyltransferase
MRMASRRVTASGAAALDDASAQATGARPPLTRRGARGIGETAAVSFRLATPLRTERLLLRPFEEGDLAALIEIQSRQDVARWLYWEPRSADEVRESLESKMTGHRLHAAGDTLSFAVVLVETGELVGDCNLTWTSDVHRQGEIGYVFNPRQHGHGYATEAARRLLELGFQELRLHRIIGRLESRNTASARVLERLGMRREAELVENEWVKGEWQSELVYAMLDREWEQSLGGA